MRLLSKKQQLPFKSKYLNTGYSDPKAVKENWKYIELGEWTKEGPSPISSHASLPWPEAGMVNIGSEIPPKRENLEHAC